MDPRCAAETVLAQRGSAQRVHRNALVSLASDAGRLADLGRRVRALMAWKSICDKWEMLNLDPFQKVPPPSYPAGGGTEPLPAGALNGTRPNGAGGNPQQAKAPTRYFGTAEIGAELPNGFTPEVVRVVTENGSTLKFTQQSFGSDP